MAPCALFPYFGHDFVPIQGASPHVDGDSDENRIVRSGNKGTRECRSLVEAEHECRSAGGRYSGDFRGNA